MSRSRWRQLATALRRLANTRPPGPIPSRVQLDLWTATDQRAAAQNGRTRWL